MSIIWNHRVKNKFSLLVPVIALGLHFGQQFLPKPVSYFEFIAIHIILPLLIAFAATWILHRKLSLLFYAWGINHSVLTGVMMAFIFCLPMLFGYGILSGFKIDISWKSFWMGCVVAAIFEELIYRGFLFGQLFRFGGWGFITAGLFNALLFGTGHLYQSNEITGALTVFFITGLGGMFFAWLYIEWDNNIWIPVFMHFFMNVSWDAFNMSENAAGDWIANLFRMATIAVSIIYTIVLKQRTGGLVIGKHNLFRNHSH